MLEVLVPRDNVNDDTVVVRTIHIESGSFANKGELVAQIETSKTNIDIETPESGFISHSLLPGMEMDVGAVLFYVASESISYENTGVNEIKISDYTYKASKAALKRAEELNLDISIIGQSCAWVSSDLVEKAAGLSGRSVRPKTNESSDQKLSIDLSVPAIKESISKRKRSEISSLLSGGHQSTSSTIGIDVELPGGRLIHPPYIFQNTISDLVVFEASRLLKKYSELNATYIDSRTIGKYEEVNFGWSFDGGSNLKVLAIKNSDQLTLADLQAAVIKLLELYESEETIPMDLLTKSTVTISDLSKTKASFMIPLINGHQSLILGLTQENLNKFSLYATFDHRVSEGLRVTSFLSELSTRILSHFFDENGVASIACYACEKTMAQEIKLLHRGFMKITLANGKEANICRNCYEGW